MNFDIIIPCAGKNTRMGSNLPKTLRKINGVVNLVNLINSFRLYSINFLIVISADPGAKKYFEDTLPINILDIIKFVKSESNTGDGAAIYEALISGYNKNKKSIICWGDIYINDTNLFTDIFTNYNDILKNDCVIPLYETKNPYVNFILDQKNNLKKIKFQKRGEKSKYGLSDYGIFIINNDAIRENLKKYKKNKKILENNFLDSILYGLHNNSIKIYPLILKKYNIFSYNTELELNKLNT